MLRVIRLHKFFPIAKRCCHSGLKTKEKPEFLEISGMKLHTDEWTNTSEKLVYLTERELMFKPNSPLRHLKLRIEEFFHQNYRKKLSTSPLFSVHDNFSPVVTVWENFDSLLVPEDHVSRNRSDTYYINKDHLLRAHTSAHQYSLISSGRDQFLVFGDVYRRDEIDRTHFACFHQMEGVRLFSAEELFYPKRLDNSSLALFETESTTRSKEKQQSHTFDCSKVLELNLKSCLEDLVKYLFGSDVECRWTNTYFPFTHPSWELEILFKGEWLESLGCGIMEQKLIESAGAGHKVGWAFGLGLERLAMKLFSIPDIRLFWSKDPGFLLQFQTDDFRKKITYEPILARLPSNLMDVSFWLPDDNFHPNDFYDLVRNVESELVEQVKLIDDFTHPKTKRRSNCYRIIYRSMERPLTNTEVNIIHNKIKETVVEKFGVELR